MANHRHHWNPGQPGFETCACGALRPSKEQRAAARSRRGLPQDRQPPKPDPFFGLSLSEGRLKAVREEEAERLRQVQEQEERVRALLSRPVIRVDELQKVAEAMSRLGTTAEAASESFRNSWVTEGSPEVKMREPTPEEALQVIFDYLERVAAERPDELVGIAGEWISRATNGIADILRKHEDDI